MPQIQTSSGLSAEILAQACFLAGPTAVGKSEAAVCLAEQSGAEIVSADSMQVFCGMEIATAKPTMLERRGIEHHLLGHAPTDSRHDAGSFLKEAKLAATDILTRGKRIIFCGGTGLYFQALLYGIGDAPPANLKLREDLNGKRLEDLVSELQALDPENAGSLDLKNKRRVVRALEVTKITGQSFTRFRSNWKSRNDGEKPSVFFLTRKREDLYSRIDARVEKMMRDGLLREAKSFVENQGLETPGASQAIGYRQLAEHFRGEKTLAEAVERIKKDTRHYAKRQLTWFRNQLPITEIQWEPAQSAKEIAFQISALWHPKTSKKEA